MSAVLTDISVSRMVEHDLLEVVEIEEQSGLSRWGWAAYYSELQGANRELMLVARLQPETQTSPQIVAYVVAREMAGELHINNIAVREEYRRKGIGKVLLNCIIKKAKEVGAKTAFLEVRAGNRAAQALYQNSGFKAIAVRSNYYSEPREDAVVMSLVLE